MAIRFHTPFALGPTYLVGVGSTLAGYVSFMSEGIKKIETPVEPSAKDKVEEAPNSEHQVDDVSSKAGQEINAERSQGNTETPIQKAEKERAATCEAATNLKAFISGESRTGALGGRRLLPLESYEAVRLCEGEKPAKKRESFTVSKENAEGAMGKVVVTDEYRKAVEAEKSSSAHIIPDSAGDKKKKDSKDHVDRRDTEEPLRSEVDRASISKKFALLYAAGDLSWLDRNASLTDIEKEVRQTWVSENENKPQFAETLKQYQRLSEAHVFPHYLNMSENQKRLVRQYESPEAKERRQTFQEKIQKGDFSDFEKLTDAKDFKLAYDHLLVYRDLKDDKANPYTRLEDFNNYFDAKNAVSFANRTGDYSQLANLPASNKTVELWLKSATDEQREAYGKKVLELQLKATPEEVTDWFAKAKGKEKSRLVFQAVQNLPEAEQKELWWSKISDSSRPAENPYTSAQHDYLRFEKNTERFLKRDKIDFDFGKSEPLSDSKLLALGDYTRAEKQFAELKTEDKSKILDAFTKAAKADDQLFLKSLPVADQFKAAHLHSINAPGDSLEQQWTNYKQFKVNDLSGHMGFTSKMSSDEMRDWLLGASSEQRQKYAEFIAARKLNAFPDINNDNIEYFKKNATQDELIAYQRWYERIEKAGDLTPLLHWRSPIRSKELSDKVIDFQNRYITGDYSYVLRQSKQNQDAWIDESIELAKDNTSNGEGPNRADVLKDVRALFKYKQELTTGNFAAVEDYLKLKTKFTNQSMEEARAQWLEENKDLHLSKKTLNATTLDDPDRLNLKEAYESYLKEVETINKHASEFRRVQFRYSDAEKYAWLQSNPELADAYQSWSSRIYRGENVLERLPKAERIELSKQYEEVLAAKVAGKSYDMALAVEALIARSSTERKDAGDRSDILLMSKAEFEIWSNNASSSEKKAYRDFINNLDCGVDLTARFTDDARREYRARLEWMVRENGVDERTRESAKFLLLATTQKKVEFDRLNDRNFTRWVANSNDNEWAQYLGDKKIQKLPDSADLPLGKQDRDESDRKILETFVENLKVLKEASSTERTEFFEKIPPVERRAIARRLPVAEDSIRLALVDALQPSVAKDRNLAAVDFVRDLTKSNPAVKTWIEQKGLTFVQGGLDSSKNIEAAIGKTNTPMKVEDARPSQMLREHFTKSAPTFEYHEALSDRGLAKKYIAELQQTNAAVRPRFDTPAVKTEITAPSQAEIKVVKELVVSNNYLPASVGNGSTLPIPIHTPIKGTDTAVVNRPSGFLEESKGFSPTVFSPKPFQSLEKSFQSVEKSWASSAKENTPQQVSTSFSSTRYENPHEASVNVRTDVPSAQKNVPSYAQAMEEVRRYVSLEGRQVSELFKSPIAEGNGARELPASASKEFLRDGSLSRETIIQRASELIRSEIAQLMQCASAQSKETQAAVQILQTLLLRTAVDRSIDDAGLNSVVLILGRNVDSPRNVQEASTSRAQASESSLRITMLQELLRGSVLSPTVNLERSRVEMAPKGAEAGVPLKGEFSGAKNLSEISIVNSGIIRSLDSKTDFAMVKGLPGDNGGNRIAAENAAVRAVILDIGGFRTFEPGMRSGIDMVTSSNRTNDASIFIIGKGVGNDAGVKSGADLGTSPKGLTGAEVSIIRVVGPGELGIKAGDAFRPIDIRHGERFVPTESSTGKVPQITSTTNLVVAGNSPVTKIDSKNDKTPDGGAKETVSASSGVNIFGASIIGTGKNQPASTQNDLGNGIAISGNSGIALQPMNLPNIVIINQDPKTGTTATTSDPDKNQKTKDPKNLTGEEADSHIPQGADQKPSKHEVIDSAVGVPFVPEPPNAPMLPPVLHDHSTSLPGLINESSGDPSDKLLIHEIEHLTEPDRELTGAHLVSEPSEKVLSVEPKPNVAESHPVELGIPQTFAADFELMQLMEKIDQGASRSCRHLDVIEQLDPVTSNNFNPAEGVTTLANQCAEWQLAHHGQETATDILVSIINEALSSSSRDDQSAENNMDQNNTVGLGPAFIPDLMGENYPSIDSESLEDKNTLPTAHIANAALSDSEIVDLIQEGLYSPEKQMLCNDDSSLAAPSTLAAAGVVEPDQQIVDFIQKTLVSAELPSDNQNSSSPESIDFISDLSGQDKITLATSLDSSIEAREEKTENRPSENRRSDKRREHCIEAIERRQSYLIMSGDTLESIAAKRLLDRRLAPLVYEINSGRIRTVIKDKKRLLQLVPNMVILLPTKKEIQSFRARPFARFAKFNYDQSVTKKNLDEIMDAALDKTLKNCD